MEGSTPRCNRPLLFCPEFSLDSETTRIRAYMNGWGGQGIYDIGFDLDFHTASAKLVRQA